ncbi:MAG: B12-binding domain-containing radical SAM protein [Deltaproteobacteria bacterium]|nr:B12-binding domain-containing radical SAM protein [Deltaproteobacteria bacterium]
MPSILFVNPSLGSKRYEAEDKLRSYLSLGTLASALKNRAFLKRYACRLGKQELILNSPKDYPDFDIRVLNLSLKSEQQSFQEYLVEFLAHFSDPPLIVGMTATSAQLDEAEEIARAAKRFVPAAIRIIGGPHVSVVPIDYLKSSEFQVACIGEGVETLAEIALWLTIIRNRDFAPIAGIAFKDETAHVHSNSLRVPLLDLDDYPAASDCLELFWEHAATPEENRQHLIYILSGYGCPHDCIFCAQRSIHGTSIRERSAKNIFEEISHLAVRGFCKFALVQETFLNRKRRIDEFCRLIEDTGLAIEWTAEARADQLAYEQLKRMQSAGLRFIQIGVESGDPALLKKLAKNIDLEQVVQLRNWCHDLKIDTAFYLLVGLPGQNWQSILRSALFMKDHPPCNRITKHASVSIAIPYPGTKIWQEQSVRLLVKDKEQFSWPERNPAVSVNEAGEFVGDNFTETDDLAPDEIFEAWLYLDDFCHFLLHAIESDQNDPPKKAKSREYADRMFYMIARRTIRDLIIRAQARISAEKRKAAYSEIVNLDGDIEKHFKDVTTATESLYDVFARFLAAVQFLNGFDTMKWLGIGNRIKWMKICAMVWHSYGREINDFHFNNDDKKTGLELNKRLRIPDDRQLNRCLAQIDNGAPLEELPDINSSNQHISAFGFTFCIENNGTLSYSTS